MLVILAREGIMRVRTDQTTSNRDITVPRPISRQKIHKNHLGQASTSSGSSCGSSICLNSRIDEEEGEDNEMVLGGPSDAVGAEATTSKSRTNGENWFSDRDDYDSDKDEDDETSQDPVANEIGPQLPGLYDHFDRDDNLPNSGIIVKVISPPDDDLPTTSSSDLSSTSKDNQLLIELRVREYQINFDGFAEINRFSTIEDMHEFIVNNTESSSLTNEPSSKQERYLEILLNERGTDRFRRLVDVSRGTVRRVLLKNVHILEKLYAAASLEKFPSPIKENNKDEAVDDDEVDYEDDDEEKYLRDVEENMKMWYMIEVIGIWLKFITDVKSYREAIKKSVLKANCGIENDRYEGIAVPLKYK